MINIGEVNLFFLNQIAERLNLLTYKDLSIYVEGESRGAF
jgi:hypothetical protein